MIMGIAISWVTALHKW